MERVWRKVVDIEEFEIVGEKFWSVKYKKGHKENEPTLYRIVA